MYPPARERLLEREPKRTMPRMRKHQYERLVRAVAARIKPGEITGSRVGGGPPLGHWNHSTSINVRNAGKPSICATSAMSFTMKYQITSVSIRSPDPGSGINYWTLAQRVVCISMLAGVRIENHFLRSGQTFEGCLNFLDHFGPIHNSPKNAVWCDWLQYLNLGFIIGWLVRW